MEGETRQTLAPCALHVHVCVCAQVDEAVCALEGMGLTHLVVRSASLPLLRALLRWGEAHAHAWDWGAAGPWGLTPLHLAAVLPDAGATARALLMEGGGARVARLVGGVGWWGAG